MLTLDGCAFAGLHLRKLRSIRIFVFINLDVIVTSARTLRIQLLMLRTSSRSPASLPVPAGFRPTTQVAILSLTGVIAVVVTGMITGSDLLQSFASGRVGMKALTAALFAVLIAGLIGESRNVRWITIVSGLLVSGFGGLAFGEYVLRADYGTGRLFGADRMRVETMMPGRMAPLTAVAFLFLGIVLLFPFRKATAGKARLLLVAVPLVIGATVLLGFLYGAREFRGGAGATPMALPTAIALVLAALAFGTAGRDNEWPWSLWAGSGATARVTRFLIPIIILIPVAAGAIRLTGETNHWFGRELGTGLIVLFHIVALLSVLFWALTRLRDSEMAQREQQEMMRRVLDAHQKIGLLDGRPLEVAQRALEVLMLAIGGEGAALLSNLDGQLTSVAVAGVVGEWTPATRDSFRESIVERQVLLVEAGVGQHEDENAGPSGSRSIVVVPSTLSLDGEAAGALAVFGRGGAMFAASTGDAVRLVSTAVSAALLRAERREREQEIAAEQAEEIGILQRRVDDISARRKAEAELLQSEERFALVSRATNDVIWDRDLVAQRLWISEGWKEQFGYPESGSLDLQAWSDAIHPDDRDQVTASLQKAFVSDATSWAEEYRLRLASGPYREILDRGLLVRDEAGTAVRMVGAMMDITVRNEAEAAIAQLHRDTELILRSAADGLIGIDRHGRSTFINPAAAHILGYEPADLIGQPLDDVIRILRADGSDCSWSECAGGETLEDGIERSGTTLFRTSKGTEVEVDYALAPMMDEKRRVTGAVMTFRDISERRAVDRMKDEFVSTVSHELRTPLTSIRGALGLLVSGRLGEFPPKAARLLEIASSNTDRLVRLINDILDIERMESGNVSMVKVPTDAADLIGQAADSMQQLADQAGIRLSVDATPAPMDADPDRIVQTLTNLIGNAIKFSPRDSTIQVSAKPADGAVVFRVADQGRGIPPEKLEAIFERFQQVDASDSRDKGGSGLGLAICRSIVRQHGGEISVGSEVGVGTEFSFTIPVDPTTVPDKLVSENRQRLVFVCDDDEDARDIMGTLLRAHGYRVVEFSNGAVLVNAALHERPDLILLDILMPEMNGWEVLGRIKSDPETAGIPVVFVSLLSQEELQSPDVAPAGWVQKPLEEEGLIQAIALALAASGPTRKMLIVEDDADLAQVIATSFERQGLEVVIASTGERAIELATTFVPAIVILDMMLPEVDGFGVIDWIKDRDLWRTVPLIVYSANELSPSQQDRLRLGPTEFITKSRIEPQEFEKRVLDLLARIIEPRPRPALTESVQ